MAFVPVQANQQQPQLRLNAVLWNAISSASVAYALTELLDNMPSAAVDRRLWCLRGDPDSPRSYHRPALSNLMFRLLCKARIPMAVQGRIASEVALRSISAGDLVYLWPPYDAHFIKRAQERGAIVIAERTNCMGEMCREVLTRAYARRGLSLPAGWCAPRDIAEEREQMLLCNFVTAPNSLVAESLLNAGLGGDRIIETSYGFNAQRLAGAIGINRPKRAPVFAFVGLGNVRKGLDVLLEAWAQASVNGMLLLAGRIDDDIRHAYGAILDRPDVRVLGFVEKIADVYSAADVFVFPSHEEGGPQVVYEAAACGLASIVSPMGAGRIIRDNLGGKIIDPLDVDSLANTLTILATDSALRQSLATEAAHMACDFEWSRVGHHQFELFRDAAQRAS